MHEKEQWRKYVFAELRLPLKGKHELEEIEERVDGKPKPFKVLKTTKLIQRKKDKLAYDYKNYVLFLVILSLLLIRIVLFTHLIS